MWFFCHTSTRVSHRYTHVLSFPNLPPNWPHPTLQPVTEPLFEFPESHSKFPLAIYFTYGIVNFICLFLHCCPENKFISTIFLDSICMCQYMIFIFLFLTHFTLALGLSTSLELTQMRSFLWLSSITLYIWNTTAALSIHLSLDI